MPRINPDILRWARETAGLSHAEAARKIDLGATKLQSGADRLAALESGEGSPSRPLLFRMAKQYRRPVLAFYLPEPPRIGERAEDFRTLPGEKDAAGEIRLDVLIREVRARKSILRGALEDHDAQELEFVGSLSIGEGVRAAIKRIKDTFQIDVSEYRAESSPGASFRLLRRNVERQGVFILLIGDLGSHHSAISTKVFRGLAIADRIAPVIVINDQDARAAWSFTLIHELTHLLLGQTAVSAGTPSRAIERFCNDTASELLLPSQELRQAFETAAPLPEEIVDWISTGATKWNLSRTLVAYRLFALGYIEETRWQVLKTYFKERWLAAREQERQKARSSEGGPSFYTVRRHRLGDGLLDATRRMLSSGSLSTSKAATVLAVKPTQVGPLLGIEATPAPTNE